MDIHIVDNGKLISEEQWLTYITSLENDFDNLETNKERSLRRIKVALLDAVRRDTTEPFGIMFSGGVDSTLLALMAQHLGKEFTCFSIGLEDAEDLMFSQKIAKQYNLKLVFKMFTLDEIESLVKQAVKLVGDDVPKVGVAVVELAVGTLALEHDAKILLGGLGSEELFCGYQRHGHALEDGYSLVHLECWKGLKNMWKQDFERDFTVAQTLEVMFKAPFLEHQVIVESMNLHPMFKIDESNNKLIVREIAESMGLAKGFAYRKKRAAQYGSSIDKAMEKLAKQKGYHGKKDYLQSLLTE